LPDNSKSLQELRATSHLPIWFKPNAGLPHIDEMGESVYDVTPEEMGAHVSEWVESGAAIVGGCCGTSPEHLHAIAIQVKKA
jgi:5-methyltetrahydrofolate--homocysteine methyltransferase